jgi:hypothetical protein
VSPVDAAAAVPLAWAPHAREAGAYGPEEKVVVSSAPERVFRRVAVLRSYVPEAEPHAVAGPHERVVVLPLGVLRAEAYALVGVYGPPVVPLLCAPQAEAYGPPAVPLLCALREEAYAPAGACGSVVLPLCVPRAEVYGLAGPHAPAVDCRAAGWALPLVGARWFSLPVRLACWR